MPAIFRIRFEHSLLIATWFINSFRVPICHYTIYIFKQVTLLHSLGRKLDGKMRISNAYTRNDPRIFTNYRYAYIHIAFEYLIRFPCRALVRIKPCFFLRQCDKNPIGVLNMYFENGKLGFFFNFSINNY